jgi:hypothetical protein
MDPHRVSRDRSTINSQLSTYPVEQVAEIIRRRGFFGYEKPANAAAAAEPALSLSNGSAANRVIV